MIETVLIHDMVPVSLQCYTGSAVLLCCTAVRGLLGGP